MGQGNESQLCERREPCKQTSKVQAGILGTILGMFPLILTVPKVLNRDYSTPIRIPLKDC